MRIVIVGAGLAGVSTALALLQRNQDVELLEAREGVALETSFANGGLLTPSLPEPWNGPGLFRHLAAAVFDRSAPMRIRPSAIPSLFGWGIRFIANSGRGCFAQATADNYRLARYSLDETLRIANRYALDFALTTNGTMCIYRDASAMRSRLQICRQLEMLGLSVRVVDAREAVGIEPSLAPIQDELEQCIWLPDDARGNAHRYCREVARHVSSMGGRISFDTAVRRIVTKNGRATGVETDAGIVEADCVVVAAGSHSPAVAGTAGVRLSIRPARGFSITLDATDVDDLPRVAVQDDASHAVAAVFDQQIRVVGIAEFGGFDRSIPERRIRQLRQALESCLPDVAARVDFGSGVPWVGLRPMSSDGRPYIGATNIPGLYVNTGHGALGWTMAAGSAALLADTLSATKPAIDPRAFSAARG